MDRLSEPSDAMAASIRRKVTLVMLLDAASEAGLVPMALVRVHTIAYLINVLAPVWDLPILEGRVLKRRGGPYYPALQNDLDRLVGLGLADVGKLAYVEEDFGRWRLEGQYSLNYELARPILDHVRSMDEERERLGFIHELVLALSSLSDADIDRAIQEDATYSDPNVTAGNVIDFAEWSTRNPTLAAARYFEAVVPAGSRIAPGEKLHLYARHLHRRIHGGR